MAATTTVIMGTDGIIRQYHDCCGALKAESEKLADISDGEINNVYDMYLLMADTSAWAGDYVLKADIDLTEDLAAEGAPSFATGLVQNPIGNATVAFSGTFDGEKHTVTGVNIYSDAIAVGLFGTAVGVTIKDLTVGGHIVLNNVITASASEASGAGLVIGALLGESTVSGITIFVKMS